MAFDAASEWHQSVCMCPGCMAGTYLAENTGGGTPSEVSFGLDPSSQESGQIGSVIDGLPIWSAYQTAQHIARFSSTYADDGDDPGTSTQVSFRFLDASGVADPNHVFDAANQALTRDIVDQFADVADVTFVELGATDSSANISFRYRDGANGGGYWNGSEVVVSRVGWEPEMDYGTYFRTLMLHEVGHAMGLAHPGVYNGSSATYADADHWNDSEQYTVMSYWNQSNTGGDFGNQTTLGLHDILALHIEYGANMGTRTGDNTYGFNSNSGDAYDFTSTRTDGSYNEVQNLDIAFTIWDAGGTDTLDFSGSAMGTELDLRQGAFGSVNGQTNNIAIAYGAVIENGVGSAHDDTMRGNEVANLIKGGTGNDQIQGGHLVAPVLDTSRDFIGITLNEDPNEFDQYASATGISAFSGTAFTVEMTVNILRMSATSTPLLSYATNWPGSTNELLLELRHDNVIRFLIGGVILETDIDTITLIDGLTHHIAFSWESATGTVTLYIDGAEVWTGVEGLGDTLESGGTLMFGQEQDSVGGSFDIRETFQGTMGDIRVFDDVRTATEIAASAFGDVAGSEPGLVHNWDVDPTDTTTVTDTKGGADLTLVGGPTVTTFATTGAASDDDELIGGEGDDTLLGGIGDDTLWGEGTELPVAPTVFNMARTDASGSPSLSGSNVDFGSSWTFEVLLERHSLTDDGYDIRLPGFRLYCWNDGTISVLFSTVTGGQQDWHYGLFRASAYDELALNRLSITYDATTGEFTGYVNGTQTYSHSFAPGALLSTTVEPLTLRLLDASFGDIRVYDRALSAAEVQATAFVELANPNGVSGLTDYWTMDGSGSAIQQVTGGHAMTDTGVTGRTSQFFEYSYDDTLDGGLGDDALYGEQGDDDLIGGAGDDDLSGGTGADMLDAGSGTNAISGGAGVDMFVFRLETATHTVSDYEVGETIRFEGMDGLTNVYTSLGWGGDAATGLGFGGRANGNRTRLEITVEQAGADTLVEVSGSDVFGVGALDGTLLTILLLNTLADDLSLDNFELA